MGGDKKWEDRRSLVFFYLFLVVRIKKWTDEKFICLIEKKKMRDLKSKVDINLQLYVSIK